MPGQRPKQKNPQIACYKWVICVCVAHCFYQKFSLVLLNFDLILFADEYINLHRQKIIS